MSVKLISNTSVVTYFGYKAITITPVSPTYVQFEAPENVQDAELHGTPPNLTQRNPGFELQDIPCTVRPSLDSNQTSEYTLVIEEAAEIDRHNNDNFEGPVAITKCLAERRHSS
ncbi:hypothetical protein PM082_003594 [Marasmius tenuissimus]|nr:hypothetical protein PM082_003594 [Marasmius tenuissimus]